ncbi:MAG: oxygen-independent coproporphyrinogen III oxidase [Candidatus Fluviicola riflensis]|nr:MAG: oxygen-independent coproporphyrinogen III oxidase [Candidatus Fluviicola riflensis]OGS77844.1 MAG: oxygen-independent coproporphyrinogen III oxidase [Candidatus Fluviicola riflensis]OGS84909.1 MAG: oxygen-independent coproporphyrinogen III oxidase [Fluviicola sp. RIFCSPHIGHO2_01_FULL_43_53]OGS89181.1 MAG: oxygen-independent coproporphyrinogen III oxidase [Fluviicola sp. RIFCSPHIGHO2_12_FULL_43_24]
MNKLIAKYNQAVPRYTSYPTVPYWDAEKPSQETWKLLIKETFIRSNESEGISLYIHLPFCESLCTYCGCNTRITVNHRVEEPYIEALLAEWKLYIDLFEEKPRIREIHLGGGTPTFFSHDNLGYLLDGILQRAELCTDAALSFEGHPDSTSSRHLAVLYQKGFRRISLGIQDFDEHVQRAIHRFQTEETVEEVTVLARSMGYDSVNYDLIYGLPLQTVESMMETINKVIRLRPDRIAFYSYAHVPWMKPGQRAYSEADLPDAETKRLLYELGRTAFEVAGYVEIGMDHFALKQDPLTKAAKQGKLHRNFMGYGTLHTQLLIGLGVSAISDTWHGFAQNEKIIESYQTRVAKGEFPFFKGHVLTEEDLILRRHILSLMCRFETSWELEEEKCEGLYAGLARLSDPIADELVIVEPFRLSVTKKGRPFLRNICMVFDARLWASESKATVFSKAI